MNSLVAILFFLLIYSDIISDLEKSCNESVNFLHTLHPDAPLLRHLLSPFFLFCFYFFLSSLRIRCKHDVPLLVNEAVFPQTSAALLTTAQWSTSRNCHWHNSVISPTELIQILPIFLLRPSTAKEDFRPQVPSGPVSLVFSPSSETFPQSFSSFTAMTFLKNAGVLFGSLSHKLL